MRSVQMLRRLVAARPSAVAALRASASSAAPLAAARSQFAAAPALVQQLQMQSRSFAGGRFSVDDDDEDYFGEDEEEDDFAIQYPPSNARVQGPAPKFTAAAVYNDDITEISLEDYRGKYVVVFFYPKDFTYVCPTEIIAFNDRAAEFEAINTQLIAVSTDSPESHLAWTKLPRNKGGLGKMDIPIVADITKIISAKYGVLLEDAGVALRGLFIIDPQGVLQQITVNNLPIGRSVDETLRLIQALQFVEEHGEVCPANWQPGEKTILANPKDSHKYFSTVEDAEDEDADAGLTVVKTKSQFESLVKSGKPVVAKFEAPWCGKCQQIQPFVLELAAKHPDVTFAKLDVSHAEVEQLKDELEVGAFPEFRFYKGGKEVGKRVSGYKKSHLKEAVEKLE
ncbi:Thioredoxin-dependent peroxide reductase [Globisporangium polare]